MKNQPNCEIATAKEKSSIFQLKRVSSDLDNLNECRARQRDALEVKERQLAEALERERQAQWTTFEFGGSFLSMTRSLDSLERVTMRCSMSTKGPPSKLRKGPELARHGEEEAAGHGGAQSTLLS